MAAENIDNTVNGTGLFPTKVPGLSDAADIQAALRLYHYGSYTYDGSNTNKANLVTPSIAKHLQNLADADAAEIVNRNTAIANAISTATGAYSDLAGNALEWNSVDERFDVEPRIANTGTIITKTESFTLSASDVGKTIILNSSSPRTVTLPANASVPIPVGYSVDIIQAGPDAVTIAEGSVAVSINSKSNIKSLDGQYSKGTLVKIDTDTWFFFGNLLNSVTPTPTPVAPTPVAPTPVAPTPVAPTPVAPTPVAPTPVAPTPVAPTPVAPTPTETTTYWATGCCLGATTNRQVTGTSTENAITAGINAISACNGSGETLGTVQEGSYTTTNNIPTLTCTAPPTPVGPTVYNIYTACDPIIPASRGGYYGTATASGTVNVGTTTNPSLSSEQIVAQLGYGSSCPSVPVSGTIYLSYCQNGVPETSGPITIDGSNFISNNINTACSDYTSLFTGAGATNISCSTVSQPAAPTNCSTTPTPVAPTPVAPTPVAPTPVAPTPVAPTPVNCQTCNSYQPNADGSFGTRNNSSCPSGSEYYTVCITPYGCENIITTGGCVPVSPTPVAPTPVAPTPVAPTPVAPTPVAPTPVAPTPTGCTDQFWEGLGPFCCGIDLCTGEVSNCGTVRTWVVTQFACG